MKRIKKKEELFKRAQDLDERKVDLTEALAHDDLCLELPLDTDIEQGSSARNSDAEAKQNYELGLN